MSEHHPAKSGPPPWHVPVAVGDIAESGRHFDLTADAGVRSAVAKLAGLRDVPRLEASFDVTRRGTDGLHVAGRVSAIVGQNCVVTLEPLANEIEETIDLLFLPQRAPLPQDQADEAGETPRDAKREGKWNNPEPLIGGIVDLGALATEFLILGINPYPRKSDAVFEPPRDGKPDVSPFAALARLAKQ